MEQPLPRARIRRGSGIRHEFGERTTAVEEGGPEGGPAEAGGGRRRCEPQARRRSPNLHRFGRGSSRERNGEMIFFPPFFFCLVFRFALSTRVEFVWRREAMGRESDLGSGLNGFRGRRWNRGSFLPAQMAQVKFMEKPNT